MVVIVLKIVSVMLYLVCNKVMFAEEYPFITHVHTYTFTWKYGFLLTGLLFMYLCKQEWW